MAVRFLLLRCWVGLVGVIAVVNALQCYWDPGYTSRRIYTLDPKQGFRIAYKIQTLQFL